MRGTTLDRGSFHTGQHFTVRHFHPYSKECESQSGAHYFIFANEHAKMPQGAPGFVSQAAQTSELLVVNWALQSNTQPTGLL